MRRLIAVIHLPSVNQGHKIIEKMRGRYMVNNSPSPIDNLLNQMPEAAKCQELTAVLRNLRKTERRLQVMHDSLFPGSRLSGSVGSLPLTVDGTTEFLTLQIYLAITNSTLENLRESELRPQSSSQ